MPSTGGTCLHPSPPPAAESAPTEPAAPSGTDDVNWLSWLLQEDDEALAGASLSDGNGTESDLDGGWQQALLADAAIHHAAQAAHVAQPGTGLV